ncbi:hypothetical protein H7I76_17640, partial [Mycolicibacterium vaccae]|nr:hypothetical protein [Mycolicibacterium vaccae]
MGSSRPPGQGHLRQHQEVLRYLLSSNMGEVFTVFFGVVLAGFIGITAAEGETIVVPLLAT